MKTFDEFINESNENKLSKYTKMRDDTISELEKIAFEKEKFFLAEDRTGRSAKPYKLDKTHIERTWDLDEEDWNSEITLREYLDECEEGDSWETNDKRLTCIEIK